MNILVVTYHSPVDITPRAFRCKSIVDMFARDDFEVELVSPCLDNPHPNRSYYGPRKLPFLGVLIKNTKSAFRRVLEFLLPGSKDLYFLPRYIRSLRRKEADVVISIGLPFSVHLAVALANQCFGLKASIFIADYGDPYSRNPGSQNCFYSIPLERLVLKKFDYVVVPTELAVNSFHGLISLDKIRVIPQSVDLTTPNAFGYVKNEIPTFCYAGLLYKKIRNPALFFDMLESIDERYIFYFYTDKENRETMDILGKYIVSLGGKLVVRQMIPRMDCIKKMSRMDFLLNFGNNSSSQTPSKLIDYSISERPFLSIDCGQSKFGEFREFLRGNYSSFRPYDLTKHDKNYVEREFMALLRYVK